MDKAIAVIGKAQVPDGYVYTKAIIQQKKSGKPERRQLNESALPGSVGQSACFYPRTFDSVLRLGESGTLRNGSLDSVHSVVCSLRG